MAMADTFPLEKLPFDQGVSHGSSCEQQTDKQRLFLLIRRTLLALCAVALLLQLEHFFFIPICQLPTHGDPSWMHNAAVERVPFDWADAQTLPALQYKPCYSDFQCARLELPLDYWNSTTNKTISLAVIRLPAVVPVTDPRYGGPIFLNPGGPGGSGVAFAIGVGSLLQKILDARIEDVMLGKEGKYYDIMSFDPRGVGHSVPAVSCFQDFGSASSWYLRVGEEGTLNSSDAALGRLWSMSHALGASCSRRGEEDIKHFISTASVARDMLELTEAHGRWRELGAKTLSEGPSGAIAEALKYKPGKEMLQYWGFSYGTYLGSTFASLFPDRVGRLILDGVVDGEDYTATLWYDNLMDTEKAFDQFYYHCARVGPSGCALATPKSSPADVEKRVKDILLNLYHDPLPVLAPVADIISWSDARVALFGSLYSPIAYFKLAASILTDLEKGDGTAFASLLRASHTYTCPRPMNDSESNSTGSGDGNEFASRAILCSDGDLQESQTKDDFTTYMHSLQALTPNFYDIWAAIRLQCIGYPLRPAYRFVGPWQGNTSHPILWIGNTADPVTPLRSAKKMARGYPDSVVLTHDAPGHSSLAAYSACTMDYIRAYFQSGELPAPGTVCPVDILPFGPGPDDVAVSAGLQMRIEAHADAARALYAAGGGLMGASVLGRIDVHMLRPLNRE